MARSACFTPATFKFQRDLATNNNREWFAANKPRYEAHLRDPFLRLLADLQGPLAAIAPHYRSDPKPVGGSLFRIQRDTRFANDKTPYKTWAGARLFHERGKQVEAPLFYIHVQPGRCFVGAGLWHPEPRVLKRVRDFLVDNPAAWTRATRSPAFRKAFVRSGDSLVRPPRGYDPAHPLIEDLKKKSLVATRAIPDAVATSPALLREVEKSLKGLAPMVDYLCAALDLEF
jgi:uncharacterized protein (TIGR02453 family)